MPEPSPEAVEALFQQAIDLDPELHGTFLDGDSFDDPDLRAAVEELLHFDAEAQNEPEFLCSPAANARALMPGRPGALPASFGRYRILRRHGEGGMGTVYEAEQDHPRRTVALKVIRPGLATAAAQSLPSRSRNPGPAPASRYRPGVRSGDGPKTAGPSSPWSSFAG